MDDISARETLSPLEAALSHARIRSYVSVPLMVQDTPIGTLNAGSEEPGFFQPDHIEMMEEIGASLAVALQQARLLEQTRQDAKTKELLLREVNHRVKNNLDAIIGLLYVERRHAPPEAQPVYRPIMERLTQRITGLAQVHEMLSQAEWAPLNLGELTEQIIHTTVRGTCDHTAVHCEVAPTPVRVSPAQAQHLALIISELTTNTLKYAGNDRDTIRINVRITQTGDTITLTYRNDGPPYPEDVLSLKWHSAGMDIITNFVRKNLRGDLTLSNEGGAVTEIRFQREE
jgi:two-component sensor histidine kinase